MYTFSVTCCNLFVADVLYRSCNCDYVLSSWQSIIDIDLALHPLVRIQSSWPSPILCDFISVSWHNLRNLITHIMHTSVSNCLQCNNVTWIFKVKLWATSYLGQHAAADCASFTHISGLVLRYRLIETILWSEPTNNDVLNAFRYQTVFGLRSKAEEDSTMRCQQVLAPAFDFITKFMSL